RRRRLPVRPPLRPALPPLPPRPPARGRRPAQIRRTPPAPNRSMWIDARRLLTQRPAASIRRGLIGIGRRTLARPVPAGRTARVAYPAGKYLVGVSWWDGALAVGLAIGSLEDPRPI